MNESPNIARIAALIGDPTRALMLQALMSGRALTASELGAAAGVGKATASAHLAQLAAGGLVSARAEGRHKYVALASPQVAGVLESLMALAAGQGAGQGVGQGPAARTLVPMVTGPRDPALRQARLCYNHLAGTRGVQLHDSLAARGGLRLDPGGLTLTAIGRDILAPLGLDPADLADHPAPHCRLCLDWSERRHHLSGRLGRAVLARLEALDWLRRSPGTRALSLTPPGRAAFERTFPVLTDRESLDAPEDCP